MSIVKDHHIREYEEEGCVRVENVFDAKTVTRLCEAIDAAHAAFGSPAFDDLSNVANRPRHQNPPSIHEGEGQIQLRNFAPNIPVLRDWLHNSAAGEVVAALMRAKHVRYWMDATFIKEGQSEASATPWHNDECTFPFRGQMMPSFWVALTDVPEENAPLITLTGSNKDPWRYHSPMSPQDAFVTEHIPWSHLEKRVAQKDAPIRVWPAKAGDILLIHPKTIHASLPRRADYAGRRVALTTRWLGDDVVWAPNPLTIKIPSLEQSGLMHVGAPPPDAFFPIIWRAQDEAH
jgi:ectoine hydroxylase-related dioxygenase (phytanoyl-CoA dioxygenase family)